YIVVARRYRPQKFADLVGQQHVSAALASAIATNRVGHAYLFTGARGVGKTSAARIFAKALDCVDGPATEPCNDCDICQGISAGDDVDVLEIDGASNRGIDEIRQLRSNVSIRPSRARYKIYIIDEVHLLTSPAFNALLKTLEEPPEHVKFIFCTTDPHKIPITVLSRCQRFDFAGIQSESIVKRLRQIVEAEQVSADDDALELLARRAAGSMRDSQSLLEQLMAFGSDKITTEVVHRMMGTADSTRLLAIAERIAANDAAGALGILDEALLEGIDVGQLLNQLLGLFRDCMVARAGCDSDTFLHTMSSDEAATVNQIADQLGLETILATLQILEQAASSLRYTTHRRTLAEIALVRACTLEGVEELTNLIAQLRNNTGLPYPSGSQSPSKQPLSKKTPSSGPLSKKKSETPRLTAASPAAQANEPSSSHAVPLSEATARQIWEEALTKLTGVVAAKAGHYDQLAAPEPNRLVVTFQQSYNVCKTFCERPEQATKIEKAVKEVTHTPVNVVYVLSENQTTTTPEATRPLTHQQKMAAASENEMVQRARELFGARPVDVEQYKEKTNKIQSCLLHTQ
ncbi:MAG: DNA polymerase III subunit gamma/tau, partial [Planctomycetales bacterium]